VALPDHLPAEFARALLDFLAETGAARGSRRDSCT